MQRKQLTKSERPAQRIFPVNMRRNDTMNKSAVLVDKHQLKLVNINIPTYICSPNTQLRVSNPRGTLIPISNKHGNKRRSISSKMLQKLLLSSLDLLSKQNENDEHKNSMLLVPKKDSSKPYSTSRKAISKFPIQIVNCLYTQNNKHFNPYIATLKQLDKHDQNSVTISFIQQQKIRKLCYVGIARNYLANKKYVTLPKYNRTGILIRSYMNKVMRDRIEKKNFEATSVLADINTSSTHKQMAPSTRANHVSEISFVHCNQTGLSFNHRERPKQIEDKISNKKYSEVIRSVNNIIEKEYIKYKLGNCSYLENVATYSEITMYVLLAMIIVCVLIWIPRLEENEEGVSELSVGAIVAMAILFGVMLFGMAMAWCECRRNISKVSESSNVIENIQANLVSYLKRVSTDELMWKVGQDFYWLEIHNIKVRRRKFYVNADDF